MNVYAPIRDAEADAIAADVMAHLIRSAEAYANWLRAKGRHAEYAGALGVCFELIRQLETLERAA